ncbi:MAG TPA: hypothetical protein VGO11_25795 [Chthoniobacteraceae bacterium]|jgi:hypothetical protein|nr:hypothetical protein [Chthoniobacteraceae bacterium]
MRAARARRKDAVSASARRAFSQNPLAKNDHSASIPFMASAAKRITGKTVKAQAARLVQALPESATWDDVMHRIYVRQKIEAGLADFRAGRLHAHAAIRKEFASA